MTFTKLQPAELLHYIDNLHRYPRASLIRHVRQKHPSFERDVESMSCVLHQVAQERYSRLQQLTFREIGMLFFKPFGCIAERSSTMKATEGLDGGILDWDDPEAEALAESIGEMAGCELDWRPEGYIPYRQQTLRGLMDPW